MATVVGILVLSTTLIVWRYYRKQAWLLVPATAGVLLLIAQVLLGGVTVLEELPDNIVMAHLATAEAMLASMVVVSVVALRGSSFPVRGDAEPQGKGLVFRLYSCSIDWGIRTAAHRFLRSRIRLRSRMWSGVAPLRWTVDSQGVQCNYAYGASSGCGAGGAIDPGSADSRVATQTGATGVGMDGGSSRWSLPGPDNCGSYGPVDGVHPFRPPLAFGHCDPCIGRTDCTGSSFIFGAQICPRRIRKCLNRAQ